MRAPAWLLLALLPLLARPALAESLDERRAAVRDRQAQAEAKISDARMRMLDVAIDQAEVDLTLSKMALDTASLLITMGEPPLRIEPWLNQARDRADKAVYDTLPSRTVEARGIFLDGGAIPHTREGIHLLIQRLAAAGFNMVLPEVFRRGYTLFPSRLAEKDPEFAAVPFDVLACLVSEAHRQGLEVHPWIWTFRVRSPGYGNPILNRFPALAARSARTNEPRFLSPADPRAREWVYALVDDMLDRYDLDGLMLDYIRYDEETPSDDTSQTTFSFDYFARHGTFPTLPGKVGSPLWQEYQLWREQQVNLTVETLSQHLHARNPRLQLSVATFRGERYARLAKMQNWRHWSDNGWVDFVTSMLYTARTSDLDTWLGWETDRHTRTNLLYPILGPHRMSDPLNQTLDQLSYLNDLNVPGALIFAYSHLAPGMLEALGAGPFRRPAMAPNGRPILAVRRLLLEIDQDYLAPIQATAPVEQAASMAVLRGELKKVQRSLPLDMAPYYPNAALSDRLKAISQLAHAMVDLHVLPRPVVEQVDHRLAYAQCLILANAQHLGATRFVPSSPPPVGSFPEPSEARD